MPKKVKIDAGSIDVKSLNKGKLSPRMASKMESYKDSELADGDMVIVEDPRPEKKSKFETLML